MITIPSLSFPPEGEPSLDKQLLTIAAQLSGMINAGEFAGANPRAIQQLRGLIVPLMNIAGDVRLMVVDGMQERGA